MGVPPYPDLDPRVAGRPPVLRRAPDIRLKYEPLAFGEGWLVLHREGEHFRLRRIDKAEFRAIYRWAEEVPQWIVAVARSACWMYRGAFFWENLGLRQHEVHALLDELVETA